MKALPNSAPALPVSRARFLGRVPGNGSILFKELWDRCLAQAQAQAKALAAQLVKIERQVSEFLDRIVDTSVPSLIGAHEERIRKLEGEKLLIREKMETAGHPATSFEQTLRTALEFLSNPWILWNSGRLEHRRAVMKRAFADRLQYDRLEGLRTVNLTLPFKLIGGFSGGENKMARLDDETSNELFEVLAEWNAYLEHRKSPDFPVPPCP